MSIIVKTQAELDAAIAAAMTDVEAPDPSLARLLHSATLRAPKNASTSL